MESPITEQRSEGKETSIQTSESESRSEKVVHSYSSESEQKSNLRSHSKLRKQKLWKKVPVDAVICKCSKRNPRGISRKFLREKVLNSERRKAIQRSVENTLSNALEIASDKTPCLKNENCVTLELINPLEKQASFPNPIIGCYSANPDQRNCVSEPLSTRSQVQIDYKDSQSNSNHIQELSCSASERLPMKYDFVNEVATKAPRKSPKAYLKIALNHMSDSLGPIGTALKYMFTPLLGPNCSIDKSPEARQRLMERSKKHQPRLRAYFSNVPLYPKTEPLEIIVKVSLEEILVGCVKKISVNRQSLDLEGNVFSENVEVSVPVPMGCHPENRIIFPREGDHHPRTSPGDLVFVIKETPHPLFWRQGIDLHYTARVTFWESLHGLELDVPTLGGTAVNMRVTSQQVFSTSKNLRLKEMGLPSVEEPEKRGDIIVNFDISRPHQLSS